MEIHELKTTNTIYDKFISEWLFFGLAFKAGRPFINGVLFKHPSETADNYTNRLAEAFNFPYCKNIVTIYNYFVTEKTAIREIASEIMENEKWKAFNSNVDLYGTNFDSFINEAQKLSGAYGTVGILIDYPSGEYTKDDIKARPYLSLYTPNNILDWTYERNDATGIPELIYLKIKEGDNIYLIWTKTEWKKYRVIKTELKETTYPNRPERGKARQRQVVEKIGSGKNRLGEIPFVFLQNIRDPEYPYLGISDITDASYVNGAIVRTLSMGSETMKLAGFPMLLYPRQSENIFLEDAPTAEETLIVSEDTVLQFDPDAKDGRPSWLESPVEPTIKAILAWMDRLTEEMYRAADLGGLHQNRDKAQTKSGTYLKYQFQQTNSVLSKKADTLTEAEKQINKFFCLWEGIDYDEDKFKISRIKEFSVDTLQIEIDNMIKSMQNVMSDHFKTKTQVKLAKQTYPDLTESDIATIREEIETNLKERKENVPEKGEQINE